MTGPRESSGVSLNGKGGPIALVYLAFPWWASGDVRGTFQVWPCGSLGASSTFPNLMISLLSLASTSWWILM